MVRRARPSFGQTGRTAIARLEVAAAAASSVPTASAAVVAVYERCVWL